MAMGPVINTNIAAIRNHNIYNRNNDFMNAAMTKVATGMRINSAKDGASTWAISEKMRERIRANDQANQNIQNDTALIKTAQGGVSNTIDILKTLKERAINASNDSNMNVDRTAIATEVQQLVKQIDDNAAKVKFNGRTLLMGNAAEDAAAASASDSTGKTLVETNNADRNAANAALKAEYDAKVAAAEEAWATSHTQAEDDVSTQMNVYTVGMTGFASGTNGTTTMANFQTSGSANIMNATSGSETVITLSWKDANGEEQSTTYTHSSSNNTKTLAEVLGSLSDSDKGIYVSVLAANDKVLYGVDTDGNADDSKRVTDANGDDLTAAAAGIYIVSTDGQISNVKLTAKNGSTDNTNFNTAVGTPSEVQEAAASGDSEAAEAEAAGDHAIYGFEGLKGASGTALATTTNLKDLEMGGTKIFTTDPTATGKIKVTYGDGENDYVELAGDKKVADLQTALAAKGINVQILGANDQVEDVDGTKVYDVQHENQMFRAPEAGLYFVSGGENGTNGMAPTALTKISFSATDDNGDDVEIKGGDASYVMEFDNSTEADTSGIEVPEYDLGANNSTLMFYIGGEQNFGMTAELGKMTADNLFQPVTYTDSTGATKQFAFTEYKDFSDLFLTKEGSQAALSVIDTALSTALNEQTKLGAIESRLGYASDNITTMNENLEAADSAMRDSDIAKEMTNYMKYSVLAQASQYMLAQSSQNAFSVLNLLQQ